jgi:hypothetical protein
MKAITILQPWASLIACGAKKIETRRWPTSYRGPLAIHAGKMPFYSMPFLNRELHKLANALELPDIFSFDKLPLGAVIAIADLVDCIEMTDQLFATQYETDQGKKEIAFGHWERGRYAWILDNVRPIEPVPAKGMQRIWNWDGEQ